MMQEKTILLVEDNINDVFLLKKALCDAEITNSVQVVDTGTAAMRYLSGEREYSNRGIYPFPCLMICNLKVSGLSCLELLRWVAEQPNLKRRIVAVVMSDVTLEKEAQQVCELGAASFLLKPFDYTELVAAMRRMKQSLSQP